MVKEKEKTEKVEIKEVSTNEEEKDSTKKADSKPKKRRVRRQRRLKDQITHNYIPEHIKLTEDEVFDLQEKMDTEKLPLILINDPAIKHIEVEAGDIIKITRNNVTVGSNYYYRKVVKI